MQEIKAAALATQCQFWSTNNDASKCDTQKKIEGKFARYIVTNMCFSPLLIASHSYQCNVHVYYMNCKHSGCSKLEENIRFRKKNVDVSNDSV